MKNPNRELNMKTKSNRERTRNKIKIVPTDNFPTFE